MENVLLIVVPCFIIKSNGLGYTAFSSSHLNFTSFSQLLHKGITEA